MSTATDTDMGTVVSLWRYPVKSMMGEELKETEVTDRGLLGDRGYALIDSSDGKAATAKNPRKWPQLFDCRATPLESVRGTKSSRFRSPSRTGPPLIVSRVISIRFCQRHSTDK